MYTTCPVHILLVEVTGEPNFWSCVLRRRTVYPHSLCNARVCILSSKHMPCFNACKALVSTGPFTLISKLYYILV